LLANLIGMGKEVGQGRMNLRVIQLRKRGDDLIDGSALQFVPDADVLNTSARPSDPRFAAAGVGSLDDLLGKGGQGGICAALCCCEMSFSCHKLIVNQKGSVPPDS